MPTNLPDRKRIRPPVDGRSLALLYSLIVAVLLSAMINHPGFFDIVSKGIEAEYAISNPLGDDQAMVMERALQSGQCNCD
jgi:hypothetical protein